MVELRRSSSDKSLSFRDRLYIIQTVVAMPAAHFNELLFVLNPPPDIVPDGSRSQEARAKALLDWVESSQGPGLIEVDKVLQGLIFPNKLEPADKLSPRAFAVSGRMGDLTPAELEAIVHLLRQKTGDTSIELAFFTEG